jgi:precorrin-2 dehydrogenase/sirohydrochlorin ferrochelatase
MLPLALDLTRLSIAVVGRGAGALRRLALLDAAGATRVTVFADTPDAALADAAGASLLRRLPQSADLAGVAVLFVADLPPPLAAALAATARAAGALVNVEDQTALCDVHVPAIVRRGDLTLAVSTGGHAPGLARVLREWLETLLDARWGDRIRLLADRRRAWRAAGHTPREVSDFTGRLIETRGWLSRRDAA